MEAPSPMNRSDRSPRTATRRLWLLVGVLLLAGAPAALAQPAPDDSTDAAQESEDDLLARRGFYQRRARGAGWFMTRADPEMARSRTLSDALRTVPGIDVIERGGGALVVSSRSAGRCPLAVYADGLYTTIRNVNELNLADLAAVEVYRGPAEVPAGFHAPMYDRTCGALLVWSRIDLDDE